MQIEELREKCVKKIKSKMPRMTITEKGSQIEIKRGKMAMVIGLMNMLEQINNSPIDEDKIINDRIELTKRYVTELKKIKTLKGVKKDIILLVKNRREIEAMENDTKKDIIYTRGFVDDLCFVLAIDTKESHMFITQNMLKEWKIDGMKAENIAIENISKMTKFEIKDVMAGLKAIRSDNASTMLAKPKMLRDMLDNAGYKGKKVLLCLPYKEELLIIDYSLENFMRYTIAVANMHKRLQKPYRVSPIPFEMDKDGVISKFSGFSGFPGVM